VPPNLSDVMNHKHSAVSACSSIRGGEDHEVHNRARQWVRPRIIRFPPGVLPERSVSVALNGFLFFESFAIALRRCLAERGSRRGAEAQRRKRKKLNWSG
jgi:hypothetical protein